MYHYIIKYTVRRIYMECVKVCAYARVSTKKSDQLNSFDNQKQFFEREINKMGYELVNIYADKGLSGVSMIRPEFLRMIYDGGIDYEIISKTNISIRASERKPKFNRIIVKDASRFARNSNVVMNIVRELRSLGVYIDFLDIGKSSENTADDTYLTIFFGFAEDESNAKSRKVRFGQYESALQGRIFVNDNIYGYRYIKKDNSLVILPGEAEVIKLIFTLYSEGYGIRRIVNYLEQNGYRTRKGKEFGKTTINKILQNHKYCGLLVRNKYTTGTDLFNKFSYKHIKPEDEWKIHEGKVPAIISEELFYKCQEIRKGNKSYQQQVGKYRGISEFAGMIVCSKCGNTYTRNTDRNRKGSDERHYFYNCSTKKQFGTKKCDNPNISEQQIKDMIQEFANGGLYHGIKFDKSDKISMLQEIKNEKLQEIDRDTSDIVNAKRLELEKLEKSKAKLMDLYLDDIFDKDTIHNKTNKVNGEIQFLLNEINELSKTNDDIYEEIAQIDKAIKEINNLEVKENYTYEEVYNLISKIEIRRNPDDEKRPFVVTSIKPLQMSDDILRKYIPDDIEQSNEVMVLERLDGKHEGKFSIEIV